MLLMIILVKKMPDYGLSHPANYVHVLHCTVNACFPYNLLQIFRRSKIILQCITYSRVGSRYTYVERKNGSIREELLNNCLFYFLIYL